MLEAKDHKNTFYSAFRPVYSHALRYNFKAFTEETQQKVAFHFKNVTHFIIKCNFSTNRIKYMIVIEYNLSLLKMSLRISAKEIQHLH